MKRSLHQTRAADRRALKVALLSAVFTAGGVAQAHAYDETTIATAPAELTATPPADTTAPAAAPVATVSAPTPAPLQVAQVNGAPPAPPSRAPINTTGHTIDLTVPAKDGAYDMGDMPLSIDPNDKITFPAKRTLDLLARLIDQTNLQALQTRFNGQSTLTPASFADTGIAVVYDPKRLELVFLIPATMRAARSVSIAALDQAKLGTYAKPANFSGYLNVRGNLDYVGAGSGGGLQDPVFALDGALDMHGLVFESSGVWQPGQSTDFQRTGSRFIYDDTQDLIRFTFGDLQAVSRGFQAVPDMFGFSIFRSYGVLEPDFVARPRGDQDFTLTRASTVEIYINGQLVRRLQLNPGNYNARDFPFTQGANDILLNIIDDTGARQTLHFSTFFDSSMLQPGLSEFGLYVGVMAPLGLSGPDYTHDWTYTGFYRRGITKDLTLGFNMQGDEHDTQAGVEGVWGTPIGSFTGNAAVSRIANVGSGSAANISFQRLFQVGGGKASTFNLFFETRSKDFSALTVLTPDNEYEYEVGGAYTQAITQDFYAGLNARFSKGRDGFRDVNSYSVNMGWRITPSLGLTLEAMYDDTDFLTNKNNVSVILSLTQRMSAWSSLRVDYNSKDETSMVTYQDQHGQGVGSYNLTADVEHTPSSTGFNGNFTYEGNRGELGITSFSTFDSDFGSATDSRTSIRFASSFAFADGSWSMGRPIYDAFAIVKPYENLKADVVVNPSPFGYDAETGGWGTAIENNLTAYSTRTLTIDVPNAPAGYDIGKGTYRMFPPHRGGYLLEVGSAYSVTAIGRLLDTDGHPIPLLAGKAYEVGTPDRPPVEIFTNREGRFGAPGLRPGKWRIVMPTQPETTFILEVPPHTLGAMRAGDLQPSKTGS